MSSRASFRLARSSIPFGAYPFPHLAGVGVALKVAHALYQKTEGDLAELPLALRPYADLVAVGTVADVVPLVEENRISRRSDSAACAAHRARVSPRCSRSAGRPSVRDARTIAFRLAPRLNAAGRLEDATLALELLGAADRDAALPLALSAWAS